MRDCQKTMSRAGKATASQIKMPFVKDKVTEKRFFIKQPADGIYAHNVNFKMAVMLCREYIRTSNADGEKLLKDIARYTVPVHHGRQDQRNLRVKGFSGFVYRVAA